MYGTRYESLEDMLTAKREWVALEAICRTDPLLKDRSEMIERWLLKAASAGDDDRCLDLGLCLIRALEDIEYLPLTEAESGRKVINLGRPEVTAAKGRLLEVRADRSIALWQKLPVDGQELFRVQDTENEGHYEKFRVPVLLKTKKALLSEIAAGWREAKNDGLAFAYLSFLLGRKFNFPEETKMIEEVFREATKPGFPPARLIRSLPTVVQHCGHYGTSRHGGIATVVAIAWARNSGVDKVTRALQAVEPVWDADEEAFEALCQSAKKLGEMHAKASKLRTELVKTVIYADCKVVVGFRQDGGFDVTMTFGPARRSDFDENKEHDRFAEKRAIVEAWQKENGGVRVFLKMVVPNHHDEKKPLFVREQKLG